MQTKELTTYLDHVPDDEGRRLVRDMIFHKQHGDPPPLVPTHVKPDVAASVLSEVVKPDMTLEQTRNACDVAMFHQAPVASKFQALLAQRERDFPDVLRSLHCLCLIGTLGDDDQRGAAAEFFHRLLNHARADEIAARLIEAYVYLDARASDQRLTEAIQKMRDRPGRGADVPAAVSARRIRLERHLKADIPLAREAKRFKDGLLSQKDSKRRAATWAKLYIGLETPGVIRWEWWSAFGIMGELKRSDAANVVEGLRAALDAIPDGQDAEFLTWARSRGTRAIVYFGGALPPNQQAWLAEGRAGPWQLQG